jgi:CheY-like chemotaxis protein/two-component sensor histidine kinase
VARGLVTISRRPIELAVIVAKAVEAVTPLIRERQHTIEIVVPGHGLPVDADEVRMTQVVTNLLTNAARYTPVGGHIEVVGGRKNAEVVLDVRDNGIGIDGALLPHVFELFVQGARGMDRSQGGLGLGLSLVSTMVKLHGGAVEARSDGPQRGSEFRVRLPLSATDVRTTAAPAAAARTSENTSRLRVLVVDDNRDAAQLIGNLLKSTGHMVHVTYDPTLALAAAATFRPEVAILDIGLPVMNGYELAGELRNLLGKSSPVMIALTGYGQEADRARSEQAGFRAHFVKPVASDQLLAFLKTLSSPME